MKSRYLRVTLATGQRASGSGFFAEVPGIVLTNAHVIGMLNPESRKPRRVEVVLDSGERGERSYDGHVLAVDRSSDLAVLRVSGPDLN